MIMPKKEHNSINSLFYQNQKLLFEKINRGDMSKFING